MKNFYRLQMNDGEGTRISEDALNQKKITADIHTAGEQFDNLKKGTVILVHKGSYPIALVKVIEKIPEQLITQPSFGIDYKVKILSKSSDTDFAEQINELNGKIPHKGTFNQVEFGNNTYKRIEKWYQAYINKQKIKLEKIDMENKISILQYKHQIILQGAPGTGKTRLAKLMAQEMTKPQEISGVQEKIDSFFKMFDTKGADFINTKLRLENLLHEFQTKFPKEKLSELTLESYTIGKGNRDNFCWWIERGLKEIGYYFPGTSRSYLIFWSKKNNDYSTHFKHSRILSETNDIETAMQKLADIYQDFVVNKNLEIVNTLLGDSLILKILHSYYPDEFFPINSVSFLNKALRILKIDSSSLNFIQKNQALQNYFVTKKQKFQSDVTAWEFMRFLVNTFNLKGDFVLENENVIISGEYKIIQFHPSYSYEDFVRGISAKTNSESQVEYKVENRVLADFAEKAMDNPKTNYVLIIDEVNRANLPSVLGELIYAMEYRFDENNPKDTTVESMYALKSDEDSDDVNENKELKLPTNLYIIGTMNTADRSVGHIDYAIRRRFAFVDVYASPEPLTEFAKPLFQTVSELFIKGYERVDWNNPKFEKSDYLSPEFRPEDVMIGHSYFLATDKDKLNLKLKYEIIPILKEYLKDGVLIENLLPDNLNINTFYDKFAVK